MNIYQIASMIIWLDIYIYIYIYIWGGYTYSVNGRLLRKAGRSESCVEMVR